MNPMNWQREAGRKRTFYKADEPDEPGKIAGADLSEAYLNRQTLSEADLERAT